MRCKDIMLDTKTGLQSLEPTYNTKMDMFKAVRRQSGVSVSMISKFWYGERSNPSINVMDKLADGVRVLTERRL